MEMQNLEFKEIVTRPREIIFNTQKMTDKEIFNKEMVRSCSISILYPNRNSVNQYRVYIDIECNDFNQAMTNALTLKE